jgi:DNA-directed RNA polymerase subunit RPC12/RpoP
MDQVLYYRCPNCGGEIAFDSKLQKMKCGYCGNSFSVDDLEAYAFSLQQQEDQHWEPYTCNSGNGDWRPEEAESLGVYHCSYCGGEIIHEKTTAATSCPYCSNPVVFSDQVSGILRPDYVIPFQLDKEAAKAALQKHLKGKLLLPKQFKSEHILDSIQGVYLPYWLFDCDSDAAIRYRATRVRHWSDARYRYTKTDHFLLLRDGRLHFDRVPVDGSKRMDNAYTEAIEPFDYRQMTDFKTAYLAGYLADRYDVRAEEAIPRANERIRNSTMAAFASTVKGYTTAKPEQVTLQYQNQQTRYALLPVWMLHTTYRGKKYVFAMNGQTGKFIGELPMSAPKFWLCFLAVAVIATPISYLLLNIISAIIGGMG